MPRARNIKPGFFKNEFLAELSPTCRLLFIGLWCLADRRGRLEDRPLKIKGELFPFESVDVDALLNELAESQGRFIIRYEADGERYIEVLNFYKHQNPHMREAESVIPPYSSLDFQNIKNEHHASTVLGTTKVVSSPADSLNLIPESLTLKTEGVCEKFSTFVETGYQYLFGSGNPNIQNVGWVKGYLQNQFVTLQNQRPDLSPEQILSCWRETVDVASSKGTANPKWFYTTFERKIQGFTPTSNPPSISQNTVQPIKDTSERDRLLASPYICRTYDKDDVIPTSECRPHDKWATIFIYQSKEMACHEWEPCQSEEVLSNA